MRSAAWLTPFVKDFGTSPEVGPQSLRSVLCDKFGDPTVRIIQVAENSYLSGTGAHAGRLFALTNQIYAKPTFYGDAFMFIHEPHLVRAGFYTVLTTHAPVSVYQDNPFRRRINGACWTNALTRSIFAMVALHGNEFFGKCRELAPFFFFDPVESVFII
jgi:hypothetical protein